LGILSWIALIAVAPVLDIAGRAPSPPSSKSLARHKIIILTLLY